MANYEISDNPKYSTEIRKLENSDPASAEKTFNPLFQSLIDNMQYLYKNKLNRDMLNVDATSLYQLVTRLNCCPVYVVASGGNANNLVINCLLLELKEGLTIAVKTGPFNFGDGVDETTITFNGVVKEVFSLSGSRKIRSSVESSVLYFTYAGDRWFLQDFGQIRATDLAFYEEENGVSKFTNSGIKMAVKNAIWEYISIPKQSHAHYTGEYKPFIYYEFEGTLTMASVFIREWDKTGPMPVYKFQFTCPDSQPSNFGIPETIIGSAEFKKKIQPGGTYVVTIMNNILTYHEILPEN